MKLKIEYYNYKTMTSREETHEINAYIIYDGYTITLSSSNFEMSHRKSGGIFAKDEIVFERIDTQYRLIEYCEGVHYDGLRDIFRIKFNSNQNELYKAIIEAAQEQSKRKGE